MAKLRYAIQEHNATHLHWDLRLEKDGVAKSWAVPKRPEFNNGEKRLLVEVEDHGLDYMGFEGTLPEGEYGAGTVKIWDSGYYEPIDIKDGKKWIINLEGKKLAGEFVLLHFKEKNCLMFSKNWSFHLFWFGIRGIAYSLIPQFHLQEIILGHRGAFQAGVDYHILLPRPIPVIMRPDIFCPELHKPFPVLSVLLNKPHEASSYTLLSC